MADASTQNVFQLFWMWWYQRNPVVLTAQDLQRYRITNYLARGGQGLIYQIRPVIAEQPAESLIYKTPSNVTRRTTIKHEYEVLRELLDYRFIPRVITHTVDELNEFTGFIRKDYPPLPLGDFQRYAESIWESLTALHDAGWVHCDIKWDNLSFDTECESIVLVDLGSAQQITAFSLDNLETAIIPANKRVSLDQQFRQYALPPTIIDYYGYALLLYRHLGGTAFGGDWKTALPLLHDIEKWDMPGIHEKLQHSLREVFRTTCVDAYPTKV